MKPLDRKTNMVYLGTSKKKGKVMLAHDNYDEIAAEQDRLMAAVRVIETERIAAQVADALQAAKDTHAALCKAQGVTQTETPDGHVVESLEKERRNFKAKILAGLVTAEVFDLVTERKVVTSKFDAAVKLGTIDPTEVAEAISKTKYTATKVYPPKG